MNLAKQSGKGDILFVNFNQDHSCLSVGTRSGFKIYNCNPFGKCYGKADGAIGIAEMLFCTSLVAQVGAGEQPSLSPRRLQLTNTKRQSIICELNFSTAILAVKMNRKRLAVVLEDTIHLYDIENMKSLHILETAANPKGVVALSPTLDNMYLAYPSRASAGAVCIFDTEQLRELAIISAHKAAITTMAFNFSGTRLATASDKGTVIRVFGAPDGALLYQLRRGTKPASVSSLCFNNASDMLCVSSDSETVHIFKLEAKASTTRRSAFLPGMLSDMIEPSRDFAHIRLPVSGHQTLSAFGTTAEAQQCVIIATADGSFYQYFLDGRNGGECALLKQFSFLDSADPAETTPMVGTDRATSPGAT